MCLGLTKYTAYPFIIFFGFAPYHAQSSVFEECQNKSNNTDELIKCMMLENRKETPPIKGTGTPSPFSENPDYFQKHRISAPVFPGGERMITR